MYTLSQIEIVVTCIFYAYARKLRYHATKLVRCVIIARDTLYLSFSDAAL